MTDIAVSTTTGDLVISDGDLSLVAGQDAIVQNLKRRLQTFLGEWFLDERVGLPYFQSIIGKGNSELAIRQIFREAILESDGIESLDDLNFDFDTSARSLTVSGTANGGTEDEITFTQELLIDV